MQMNISLPPKMYEMVQDRVKSGVGIHTRFNTVLNHLIHFGREGDIHLHRIFSCIVKDSINIAHIFTFSSCFVKYSRGPELPQSPGLNCPECSLMPRWCGGGGGRAGLWYLFYNFHVQAWPIFNLEVFFKKGFVFRNIYIIRTSFL